MLNGFYKKCGSKPHSCINIYCALIDENSYIGHSILCSVDYNKEVNCSVWIRMC